MRADWKDKLCQGIAGARNNKSKRVLVFLALLGGSLGLYLLDGRGGVEPRSAAAGGNDNVVEDARVPTGQEMAPVAALIVPEPPKRTAEMRFWEQVERDRKQKSTTEKRNYEPEEPGRQTSFSDANYTPPKQVNTIKSVAVEPPRRSPGSRQQTLTGSKSASVQWEDARGNIFRWKTSFDFQNSRIDNSTFCLNVGKGSIPYRECRKGAQQWLKDQCRADHSTSDEWRRMYCQAYRNYRT